MAGGSWDIWDDEVGLTRISEDISDTLPSLPGSEAVQRRDGESIL
eukprot:CAMPEP_0167804802 /NCGR_PEP_ID=MMETSP0111_2-20121227/20731_1 /TAXON_ID=91324 /ORGANISM="Lotharella globosa, Strain CCCM811" /LENGTH=44 /DNA_ID= /DNA_START= /DNA_END= /DNA_ORIENTATION=